MGLVIRWLRWVPKILTKEQKQKKMACEENLALNAMDSESFLGHIVTCDETYAHHFEPETKRQSMQWLSPKSQAPIKTIKKLSSKKFMALVFWDKLGPILVKFFLKGATLNGEAYTKILGHVKTAIQRKRGSMWEEGVYLLHDNASPHTCRVAQRAIEDLGFIQLTHPPYSPDLAPSDYYLFPKMKDKLQSGFVFVTHHDFVSASDCLRNYETINPLSTEWIHYPPGVPTMQEDHNPQKVTMWMWIITCQSC